MVVGKEVQGCTGTGFHASVGNILFVPISTCAANPYLVFNLTNIVSARCPELVTAGARKSCPPSDQLSGRLNDPQTLSSADSVG